MVVPIRWYFACLFVLSAASCCLIMMLSTALVTDRFNVHMSNTLVNSSAYFTAAMLAKVFLS